MSATLQNSTTMSYNFHIASLPAPTQLSLTCNTERQESQNSVHCASTYCAKMGHGKIIQPRLHTMDKQYNIHKLVKDQHCHVQTVLYSMYLKN